MGKATNWTGDDHAVNDTRTNAANWSNGVMTAGDTVGFADDIESLWDAATPALTLVSFSTVGIPATALKTVSDSELTAALTVTGALTVGSTAIQIDWYGTTTDAATVIFAGANDNYGVLAGASISFASGTAANFGTINGDVTFVEVGNQQVDGVINGTATFTAGVLGGGVVRDVVFSAAAATPTGGTITASLSNAAGSAETPLDISALTIGPGCAIVNTGFLAYTGNLLCRTISTSAGKAVTITGNCTLFEAPTGAGSLVVTGTLSWKRRARAGVLGPAITAGRIDAASGAYPRCAV